MSMSAMPICLRPKKSYRPGDRISVRSIFYFCCGFSDDARESYRSPGLVESELQPVELESVVGGVLERRTGQGGIVFLDEEV